QPGQRTSIAISHRRADRLGPSVPAARAPGWGRRTPSATGGTGPRPFRARPGTRPAADLPRRLPPAPDASGPACPGAPRPVPRPRHRPSSAAGMNPPRPLRIGPLQLDLPAVQAALSGYSDLPMRRVARAHGAPFCVNEVVLDEAVLTRGRLQRRILDVRPDDHPVAGQLMGAVPETFGRAARELVRAGYDVVDVNFGCPVPKVLGRCRGGYLLGDPGTALDIVERVVDACAGDVPVMVKM